MDERLSCRLQRIRPLTPSLVSKPLTLETLRPVQGIASNEEDLILAMTDTVEINVEKGIRHGIDFFRISRTSQNVRVPAETKL